MSWTLQECIRNLKSAYPKSYPYAFIETDGVYLFNLLSKGADQKDALADFHLVDPEQEIISGYISPMELLQSEKFREKWKHANLVANHDEDLQHGLKKNTIYSAIRKSDSSEDSLTHYGIKGMAWGVKNGPPYPLDSKTSSAVKNGKNPGEKKKAGENQNGSSEVAGAIDPVLVYNLVELATVFIVAPLAMHFIKKNAHKKYMEESDRMSEEIIGDISENKKFSADDPPKKIEGSHTIEEDMEAVNPKYQEGTVMETAANCVFCSTTYDLRRRGYDVTAKPSATGNITDLCLKELYGNGHMDGVGGATWTDVYQKASKKYPEGSRGIITVSGYMNGMGHAMAWEIQKGKLVIIDAQRNVKSSAKELNNLGFNPRSTQMFRTDNRQVNLDNVNRSACELKNDWKKIYEKQKKERAAEKAKADRLAIRQYKDDHPGTEMTNDEILETLKRKSRNKKYGF